MQGTACCGHTRWNSRTTTRRSASPRPPARRRSSRPSGKWRGSTTPTSIPATSRPRSRFKEINEAYEVDRRSGQAQEIRRARIELEDVRAGAARGRRGRRWIRSGSVGRNSAAGWRRPGQLSHDDARRDARSVRQRRSVLRFLSCVLLGGGEPQMRGREGAPGSRVAAPRQGRDVEHPLDLSLEDAYRGTTRRLVARSTTATRAPSM